MAGKKPTRQEEAPAQAKIELAVLDDSKDVLELFKEGLPKDRYTVSIYDMPGKLLDDIEQQTRDFHVIIVDRQITPNPERAVRLESGDSVIEMLKNDKDLQSKLPSLKLVISISGYGVKARYADAHLAKPFTLSHLDSFIQERLAGEKFNDSSPYRPFSSRDHSLHEGD